MCHTVHMSNTWKAQERAMNAYFMKELKVAIARAELTSTEVARRAGFQQQQVSEWLANRATITTPRFMALAHAIGLSDDEALEILREGLRRANDAGVMDEDRDARPGTLASIAAYAGGLVAVAHLVSSALDPVAASVS